MISIEMDESGTVTLAGDATVAEAGNLHAGLVRVLQDRTEGLVLDLGGLSAIDVAGVQVVIAFRRAVPGLRVQSCPPAIREKLERMNLLVHVV